MTVQAETKASEATMVFVVSRRPFGFYHRPSGPKTPCGIITNGYGQVITLTEALKDACTPCPTCWVPPVPTLRHVRSR